MYNYSKVCPENVILTIKSLGQAKLQTFRLFDLTPIQNLLLQD